MDKEYSPASKPSPPSLPRDKFFFSVDKSDVGRTGFVKLRGRGSKIMKYISFSTSGGVQNVKGHRHVLVLTSLQLDLNANL